MLPLRFFSRPALHGRLARRRARLLRDDGLGLRVHAVPAVRARLQRAGGGRGDAAARPGPRRRLGRLEQARRALRPDARDRGRPGRRRGGASTSLLWTPDMAPSLLALVTFGLALSMGAAMAPATDFGHERRARGEGRRRLRDERRHPAGRRRARRRRHRLDDRQRLRRATWPRPRAAGESVGAAHAEAAQLGGAAGQELAATAGRAFTDALGIGLTAAAAVALAGACSSCGAFPTGG